MSNNSGKTKVKIYKIVKPVLRGHLWNKEREFL